MANSHTLKLRQQWFKLKTKEFIARNSAGLMVLVLFLPGVAIGDNFKMLMSGLSQPFLLLAAVDTPFVNKLLWIALLILIFIVWSRAQRLAITGGAFMTYLQSLPLNSKQKNVDDFRLLMRANHLLWVMIFASAYFLYQPTPSLLTLFNYIFLLFFLFTMQYVAVFKPEKQSFISLGIIALTFIMPLSKNSSWLRLIALALFLVFTILSLFVTRNKTTKNNEAPRLILPYILSNNLHFQMLFKATLTSTLFRLGLVTGFSTSLILLSQHFIKTSNNELLPYAYVLEAVIAYYLSGFFIIFSDERKGMKHLFASLPLNKLFWVKRDIFVVILMALTLHVIYFIGLSHFFVIHSLFSLFVFHTLLLLVCFPLRTLVKKNQPFIVFVVLLIITVITIFNLS